MPSSRPMDILKSLIFLAIIYTFPIISHADDPPADQPPADQPPADQPAADPPPNAESPPADSGAAAADSSGSGGGKSDEASSSAIGDPNCLSPGSPSATVNLKLHSEESKTKEKEVPEEEWKKIRMNRYYGVLRDRFYIQNLDNGFLAIQLHEGTQTSDAIIRGPDKDWDEEYVLGKIDVFWSKKNMVGAQHALSGETYPFELLLVHYQKKLKTMADAMDTNHGILVIGILFEANGMQNPPLDSLSSGALMSGFPQDKMQIAHGPLDIKSLFPYDLTNVQYTGPYMVKPLCTKKAKFVVFTNPRQISYKQLRRFREVRNANGEKNPGLYTDKEMATIDNFTVVKNIKLSILKSADISESSSSSTKIMPLLVMYKIIWIIAYSEIF